MQLACNGVLVVTFDIQFSMQKTKKKDFAILVDTNPDRFTIKINARNSILKDSIVVQSI